MKKYNVDIIILGAGFAGSLIGTILSKHGLKVAILEKGAFPRFAIGESTIPQTSAMMKLLSLKHNIPEFNNLSSFQQIHKNITASCGIKRNFGFIYHGETNETLLGYQLGALGSRKLNFSPEAPVETHLFRQDIDIYINQIAEKYGCSIFQSSPVSNIKIADTISTIETSDSTFHAPFIIDGSGFSSLLAKHFDLRTNKFISTTSRSLFTHMTGVIPFDDIKKVKRKKAAKWHEGTLHHIFDGGWLWVIPFNNYHSGNNALTSVGLQLDLNKYPMNSLKPEQEFRNFLNKYPYIKKQFLNANPVRPWVKTGRLQYAAKTACSHNYALLSHSYGFIDPLFSRGLNNSLEAIDLISDALICDFDKSGKLTKSNIDKINKQQASHISWNDKLVHGAYLSFSNPELWNAWYRVWGLNQPLGMYKTSSQLYLYDKKRNIKEIRKTVNEKTLGQIAPDFPKYQQLLNSAYELILKKDSLFSNPASCSQSIFEMLNKADFLPPHFPYRNRKKTFGNESYIQQLRKYLWFKNQLKRKPNEE